MPRTGVEPLMLIPGSQLLVYPILWILMPREIDEPATTTWTAPAG